MLEQFSDASKGKVDNKFWSEIYQRQTVGCSSAAVSGWITKFFPYSGSGETVYTRKNLRQAMSHDAFTPGIAKANFYWIISGVYQIELKKRMLSTQTILRLGNKVKHRAVYNIIDPVRP